MGTQDVSLLQPDLPEEKSTDVLQVVRTAAGADQGVWMTVWRRMNEYDAMTVFLPGREEFRQVVEVETEELRRLLTQLPPGTSIHARMKPVGGRGDAWRVVGVP